MMMWIGCSSSSQFISYSWLKVADHYGSGCMKSIEVVLIFFIAQIIFCEIKRL